MTTNKTENAVRLTNKTALLYAKAAILGQPIPAEYEGFVPAEVAEKFDKMIDQLDKKNAGPKKMTKTQEANAANTVEILRFLSAHPGEGFTCADLIKSVAVLNGKSNQYVSAIMKIAGENGTVEKYMDKRRAYFRIVPGTVVPAED